MKRQVIYNYKKENVDYSILTDYLVKKLGERLNEEIQEQYSIVK